MRIALFFTKGVSLKYWVESGLFDREKLIYEEHLKKGNFDKIYWFTYGSDDKKVESELKDAKRLHTDIEVIPLPNLFNTNIGITLYSVLIPLLHGKILNNVDMLKTNQMDGSWSAIISKWLYKKPLLVRTGYTASLLSRNLSKSIVTIRMYELMESLAYRYCDIGVVSSKRDKEYICQKYSIKPDKVTVIYNYVDIDRFHPIECKKYDDRIIFVGRLNGEKNLHNLIEAIAKLRLNLDIYGNGELKKELESMAKELNAKVSFRGSVPNNELPDILNKYLYFILPSFYEGMPKALLEAMACGLVCIGTNVEGINEVIEDDITGYLAKGTDDIHLLEAIKKALESDNGGVRRRAVEKINREFSLGSVVEKEMRIIQGMLR